MTMIQQLAGRGHACARRVMDAFNPDQLRDEKGMWSGEGSTASTAEQHQKAASDHLKAASVAITAGDRGSYNDHTAAMMAHQRAANIHRDVDFVERRFGEGKVIGASDRRQRATTEAQTASKVAGPTSNTRATQKEIPAVAEASSRQLAMSQRVPAGAGERHEPGHDPNKTTMREMPAVGGGRPLDRSTIAGSGMAGVTARQNQAKLEHARAVAAGMDPVSRGSLSKSSRAEAAASAAGQWASRALEKGSMRDKNGNIRGAVYGVKKGYKGIKTR